MKDRHSRREDRKAADVVERSRDESARPSIAAQNEVKSSEAGYVVVEEDESVLLLAKRIYARDKIKK